MGRPSQMGRIAGPKVSSIIRKCLRYQVGLEWFLLFRWICDFYLFFFSSSVTALTTTPPSDEEKETEQEELMMFPPHLLAKKNVKTTPNAQDGFGIHLNMLEIQMCAGWRKRQLKPVLELLPTWTEFPDQNFVTILLHKKQVGLDKDENAILTSYVCYATLDSQETMAENLYQNKKKNNDYDEYVNFKLVV